MFEAQFPCVKREAVEHDFYAALGLAQRGVEFAHAQRRFAAVERIIDQRITERREMHADLVRATGLGTHAQEGIAPEALERFEMRFTGFAFGAALVERDA